MLNTEKDEVIATQAKPDGPVFKKYLRQGFQPIGWVWGMNVGVCGLGIENYPKIAQAISDVRDEVLQLHRIDTSVDKDHIKEQIFEELFL